MEKCKVTGCNKKETFAGGMFEVFCGVSEMWYGIFYCKKCKENVTISKPKNI